MTSNQSTILSPVALEDAKQAIKRLSDLLAIMRRMSTQPDGSQYQDALLYAIEEAAECADAALKG